MKRREISCSPKPQKNIIFSLFTRNIKHTAELNQMYVTLADVIFEDYTDRSIRNKLPTV